MYIFVNCQYVSLSTFECVYPFKINYTGTSRLELLGAANLGKNTIKEVGTFSNTPGWNEILVYFFTTQVYIIDYSQCNSMFWFIKTHFEIDDNVNIVRKHFRKKI